MRPTPTPIPPAPRAPWYARVWSWVTQHVWQTAVILFFIGALLVSLCAPSAGG